MTPILTYQFSPYTRGNYYGFFKVWDYTMSHKGVYMMGAILEKKEGKIYHWSLLKIKLDISFSGENVC